MPLLYLSSCDLCDFNPIYDDVYLQFLAVGIHKCLERWLERETENEREGEIEKDTERERERVKEKGSERV